ncbi:MAG: oxidoreductase [Candidatus Margulisiibacteriota bacterium]|nr:MAG: oxidoreductase [Candidatus Margulisbacteria bacterium GWD2_39_127]OGI05035.1 MAG: oxidoreductase [Candidatus Margulisbacteria bacterium GWF2_38_17]OGI08077.1 MAG: oxidoreductase [Candidatus Margulisbacteria bacterium GWE2_39_32]PZM79740.1 MAG: oxidoreductase [Candidatus Margulisiibacteriota bacterium]HAR63270.1 oxidoreductase [Candidatus Margulisiibacteriota bacterium]
MGSGLVRIFLYLAVVLAPLIISMFYRQQTTNNFLYELGRNFALVGIMVLTIQILLAGRFKWIESSFGFDILIRYHRYMAIFGTILIIAHPLLLAAGTGKLTLLIGLTMPWYIWLGRAALVLLIINALVSVYQSKLHLKFEVWRFIHDITGPSIILFSFVHSWIVGDDIHSQPLYWLWPIILIIFFVLFAYHRFIRPLLLNRHPYLVTDVIQESKGVWTVKLAPSKGERIKKYLPGQFHFLTFHRGKSLPEEEHHWTISSSPTEKKYVSSTIKELGDFTATIGETKPGDTATVHAAFGRFSYLLHPEEKSLVFIAGGIGITPLMSMLRYMRDIHETIPVVLLYGSKTEEEIVFRKELAEMQEKQFPRLQAVHILSDPGKKWTGETGLIDRDKLIKHCGKLDNKGFYIVGPKDLLDGTVKNLRELGVNDERIHIEIFSFID